MSDVSSFFKMAFSVDCVIFGFDEGKIKILIIKRGEDPFKGFWALPGNLVYLDEDLNLSAKRVLHELTGLQNVPMQQVSTFGTVSRHPLGRVITTAYYALVKPSTLHAYASSHVEQIAWLPIDEVEELAFDHNIILESCLSKLRSAIKNRPIGFDLLPKQFTLSALQKLYEAILGTSLDKRNFRKKILSMEILEDKGVTQEGVAHRPAKLFQFDAEKYKAIAEDGFLFQL